MRVLPRPRTAELATNGAWRPTGWLTPYLFLLPYLLFFLAFRLGPSVFGLAMSFTNWTITESPKWIGLKNFQRMQIDPRLETALRNTAFFAGLTVPLLVVLALMLAIFLNQPRRGRALGRVAVFTPYVLMSTVVGLIWTWILEKDFGLLNVYLSQFGLDKIPWLVNKDYAMYGIILTTVWWTVGYDTVLFLAGLQDIPEELYEAARIDGAGPLGLFRHVTLPLLAPTTFVVIMLTIINSFQVFDQVYVMTSGGPGTATLTLVQYIYTSAFQFRRMGYGAAVASLLFGILIVFALLQTRAYRRGIKGEWLP
ncbi:MAG: carbohydrate ABC transporter permease [Aggregatilineaceae bacterium]